MRHASGHHNKRFSPLSRRGALWAAAVVALALSALGGWAPLRAAAAQEKSSDKAAESAKTERSPFRASQDVEVGKFYMNKGRYDAAISRFEGAVKHDPGWAMPYLYLGEAYEKKEDSKRAIAAYQKYLKIKPYAKDAKKIKERIEKLTQEIKEQNAQAR